MALINNTKNISLDEEVIKSESFQSFFCENWHTSAEVLESLKSAVKNPVVKWFFEIAINTGDSVFEKTCNQTETNNV